MGGSKSDFVRLHTYTVQLIYPPLRKLLMVSRAGTRHLSITVAGQRDKYSADGSPAGISDRTIIHMVAPHGLPYVVFLKTNWNINK